MIDFEKLTEAVNQAIPHVPEYEGELFEVMLILDLYKKMMSEEKEQLNFLNEYPSEPCIISTYETRRSFATNCKLKTDKYCSIKIDRNKENCLCIPYPSKCPRMQQ